MGDGRALVVGFGNVYRRDDGVGRAVVSALRQRLGRPPLSSTGDGFDTLGSAIDTALLHQLVPELAEMVADYDLVIFIDAHVVGDHAADLLEPVHEERVVASPCRSAFVPHQMHPGVLLDLAGRMYGRAPEGVLLSLRGYDFDFGEGLSAGTAALIPQAVERILALVSVSCGLQVATA